MSVLGRAISKLIPAKSPAVPVCDADLLGRFIHTRDEAAFEELIRRHGPLVYAVAVRVVRDKHAAEDVFQATFLVLARDAHKLRKRAAVASWLHGTALRMAKKALRRRHRLLIGEVDVDSLKTNPFEAIGTAYDQQVLDEELQRLPAKYREPLVRHFLEGQTYQDTAKSLGISLGAVEGRIKRGKRELQLRLARRGVGFGIALASMCWSQSAAHAAMSTTIIHSTLAGGLAAAQGTPFAPALSPEAVHLAGKEAAMLTAGKAIAAAVLLTAAGGLGWLGANGDGNGPGRVPEGAVSTELAGVGDGGALQLTQANRPEAKFADEESSSRLPRWNNLRVSPILELGVAVLESDAENIQKIRTFLQPLTEAQPTGTNPRTVEDERGPAYPIGLDWAFGENIGGIDVTQRDDRTYNVAATPAQMREMMLAAEQWQNAKDKYRREIFGQLQGTFTFIESTRPDQLIIRGESGKLPVKLLQALDAPIEVTPLFNERINNGPMSIRVRDPDRYPVPDGLPLDLVAELENIRATRAAELKALQESQEPMRNFLRGATKFTVNQLLGPLVPVVDGFANSARRRAASVEDSGENSSEVGRAVNDPAVRGDNSLPESLRRQSRPIVPPASATADRIYDFLQNRINQNFVGLPLRDVVQFLADTGKIPIVLDKVALDKAGVTGEEEIAQTTGDAPVHEVLDTILRDYHGAPLTYIVEDDVLKITTVAHADSYVTFNVYDLGEHFSATDSTADRRKRREEILDAVNPGREGYQSPYTPVNIEVTADGEVLTVRQTPLGQKKVQAALVELLARQPENNLAPNQPNNEVLPELASQLAQQNAAQPAPPAAAPPQPLDPAEQLQRMRKEVVDGIAEAQLTPEQRDLRERAAQLVQGREQEPPPREQLQQLREQVVEGIAASENEVNSKEDLALKLLYAVRELEEKNDLIESLQASVQRFKKITDEMDARGQAAVQPEALPPLPDTPPGDFDSFRRRHERTGRILDTFNEVSPNDFKGLPVRDVMQFLSDRYQFPILIDYAALEKDGLTGEEVIAVTTTGLPVGSALKLMLDPLQLAYTIEDDVLKITSRPRAESTYLTRAYLLRSIGDDVDNIMAQIKNGTRAEDWVDGSMQSFRGALFVRQNERVHGEIRAILNMLYGTNRFAKMFAEQELALQKEAVEKSAVINPPPSERVQKILSALDEISPNDFNGLPLRDVMQFLADRHMIPIVLDTPHLEQEGITGDEEVRMSVVGIPLRNALDLLLESVNGVPLTWIVEDEVMKITTRTKAYATLVTRMYDVRTIPLSESELLQAIRSGTSAQAVAEMMDRSYQGTLEIANGLLIARQSHVVQREIESLLRDLARSAPARQPRASAAEPRSDYAPVARPLPQVEEWTQPEANKPEVVEEKSPILPVDPPPSPDRPIEAIRVTPPPSQEEIYIRAALRRATNLVMRDVSLQDMLKEIRNRTQINIRIDELGLSEEGLSAEQKVHVDVDRIELGTILRLVLEPLNLTYTVQDASLSITSMPRAAKTLVTRIYDVRGFPQAGEGLVNVVMAAVPEGDWNNSDGIPISLFNGSLIVRQNHAAHEQIEGLLNHLLQQTQSASR